MAGVTRSEPLYAFSGTIFFSWPGVPLGLARRAIDVAQSLIEGGRTVIFPPPPRPARSLPHVRAALARAETVLGAARAYVYESLDALWDELMSNGRASPRRSRALLLSAIEAYRAGRQVAQLMYDTVGTAAVFARCPLDRLLRDAITMSQHAILQENTIEVVGGVMLGEPSPVSWLS
jgi:indole-3-acetate monooxygenase